MTRPRTSARSSKSPGFRKNRFAQTEPAEMVATVTTRKNLAVPPNVARMRVLPFIAGVTLMYATVAGCATTTMTAVGARVPVLVGPVACIGCVAGPPVATIAGSAPISDTAVHRAGYVTLPRIGNVDFFGDDPPAIILKANGLAADPCETDVQLSTIKVESFGIVAFVYAKAEQTVNVTGLVRPVPGGSCRP
jgi:hypothetical protein